MSAALWAVTALLGLLALTHAVSATWHPTIYVLQAFTVPAGAAAVLLAVLGVTTSRPVLGAVNVAIAAAMALVVAPAVRRTSTRSDSGGDAEGASLTVLHVNTYYDNRKVERAADVLVAAVDAHDVDVLVVTEYSPVLEQALVRRLGDRFTHSAGASTDERNGLGLLSRHPLRDVRFAPYRFMPGLEVTVEGIRVIAVHPVPGVARADLRLWHDDLAHIGDRALAPDTPPTVVVGDFNAARWHPPFRRLLDHGLADAHEMLGRGLSTSWPVDWWRPRFVRLDHALVDQRLTPISVHDLVVPGSDHTGFVVRVRR